MTISIQHFEEPHRDQMKALWETCGLTVSHNDPDEDLDRFLKFDNAKVLVALDEADESRVVGSACLCHDAHRGYVYYLAVDPDLRASGIGRRFMELAEQWTAELGLIKMHIFVRDTNLTVKSFYENLGYAQQGVALMVKFL